MSGATPAIVVTILDVAIVLLEAVGAAAIGLGAAAAGVLYVRRIVGRQDAEETFRQFRSGLGRSILVGLEFLIGADIIRTITTELSAESLLSLGALIAIRALLSLTLEVEIDGRWPWDRWRSRDDR